MFNMYQELVDRINELLKIKKRQDKLIERLKLLYIKIPYETIVELEHDKILTQKEKEYWLQLSHSRRRRKNVPNNDKDKV